MNKKYDFFGNEIKRVVKKGEAYLVYNWEGHKLMFLEEDVETYQYYSLSDIEMAFSIYVHIFLEKPLEKATTKEVKDAILHGANEDLSLYQIRIKEQAEGDIPDPTFGYNEKVGLFFFRKPQPLSMLGENKSYRMRWFIIKQEEGDAEPQAVCYSFAEKYDDRLEKLFLAEYRDKGYKMFYHLIEGRGFYRKH